MDHSQPPSTLAWLDGRDLIATVAWHDPAVTAGFDSADTYVETYWLPMLGPSATWALRRIAAWLAKAPASGLWLPVEPLARSLGIGSSAGRNATARRTIKRLVDFHLAYVDLDRDVLAVRTLIPPLSERAIDRLPGHLLVQHRADYPTVAAAAQTAPGTYTALEVVDARQQCPARIGTKPLRGGSGIGKPRCLPSTTSMVRPDPSVGI